MFFLIEFIVFNVLFLILVVINFFFFGVLSGFIFIYVFCNICGLVEIVWLLLFLCKVFIIGGKILCWIV